MTHAPLIKCAKCGQQLPAHATACPSCRTPTPFTPERLREMGVDVNARMMWGDSRGEIREAWLKKGAPAEALDQALSAASRERREHFRTRGKLDLLMALGLWVVGGIGFWIIQAVESGQFSIRGRSYVIVSIGMLAAPLAGILLGIRGLRRLSVGGDAEEAATNIDYSD